MRDAAGEDGKMVDRPAFVEQRHLRVTARLFRSLVRIAVRHSHNRVNLLALALVVVVFGCDRGPILPDPSSSEYKKVVKAFYVGLTALQVGDDARADESFAAVTRIASAEPAGWANWGVLALRQRDFDLASQRLEHARDLAPQDGHIYNLLGMLDSEQ